MTAYKKKTQLFEKRRELIGSIPKFWPTALKNNDEISAELEHDDDLKALDSLTDVWVSRDPSEPRAYTIEFVRISRHLDILVFALIGMYLIPDIREKHLL